MSQHWIVLSTNLHPSEKEFADLIKKEAADKLLTPSAYIKTILENRHSNGNTTVVPVDVRAVTGKYEAVVGVLKEQITQLQNRLDEALRSEALSGVENKNQFRKSDFDRYVKDFEKSQQIKELEKERDQLHQVLDDKTQELKEVLSQKAEVEQEMDKIDKLESTVQVVANGLGTLAKFFPALGKKMESRLAGLLDEAVPEATLSMLSPEDESRLSYIKALEDSFQGQELEKLKTVLAHFMAHPAMMSSTYQVIQMQKQS